MRRLLLIVLTFAVACNVWAQKQHPEKLTLVNAPINIASEEIKKSFTPPAEYGLKSGSVAQSDYEVEFVDFPEEAESAFLYAISICEDLISSTVPIRVQAVWDDLGSNTLAQSKPSCFYKNFDGARLSDVYYPVALVEKLAEKEYNDSDADIVCTFSSDISWYLGIDGDCPSDKYDFVSVAIHEMVHGFGFVGFFDVDDGIGNLDNSNGVPSIYDVYIYNSINQQITDESIYEIPSTTLGDVLTSNSLVLKGSDGVDKEDVYAPSSWIRGSSVYHYAETGFESDDANALMSPYIYKGEAIHYPGDKTMELLAEFGWESLSFEDAEICDIETAVENLPVAIQLSSELEIDSSSVQIIYSVDKFVSSKNVSLEYNLDTKKFEGEISLDNYKGTVQYYYKATSENNIDFTSPSMAPDDIYYFYIGTDYYPPELYHNPEQLVVATNPSLDMIAEATDNVGVETIKIEYLINGEVQEYLVLEDKGSDTYQGELELPEGLTDDDLVQYRVIAIDISCRGNTRYLPSSGYYTVDVCESETPVRGYYTDFNNANTDFNFSNFEMTAPDGFSDVNLHTVSPYPESSIENQKYSLVAQLKYPIIIEENGTMSFDEVVLVEPGDDGAVYTEETFWDFVIVEGSKDCGKNWLAVTDGYDSGLDELWNFSFTNSLKSTVSEAEGEEDMFLTQTINLTENTAFEAGDTVLFRFRLASDTEVTGWGWAIDNLSIQEVTTATDDILAQDEVVIYPNPFSESIYIEGFDSGNASDVEVIVTDLYGKTVYRETRYDASYSQKFKVDLPNIAPGIYLASVTDNQSNKITQRIIKK